MAKNAHHFAQNGPKRRRWRAKTDFFIYYFILYKVIQLTQTAQAKLKPQLREHVIEHVYVAIRVSLLPKTYHLYHF